MEEEIIKQGPFEKFEQEKNNLLDMLELMRVRNFNERKEQYEGKLENILTQHNIDVDGLSLEEKINLLQQTRSTLEGAGYDVEGLTELYEEYLAFPMEEEEMNSLKEEFKQTIQENSAEARRYQNEMVDEIAKRQTEIEQLQKRNEILTDGLTISSNENIIAELQAEIEIFRKTIDRVQGFLSAFEELDNIDIEFIEDIRDYLETIPGREQTATKQTEGVPSTPASTPASTAPTRPASTAPTRPASTAPTRPVSTAPTRPASTAPTRPASTAPTRPVSTAPTRPVSTAPTRPASTAPTRPVSTVPTRPASTAPTRPASTPVRTPVSTPAVKRLNREDVEIDIGSKLTIGFHKGIDQIVEYGEKTYVICKDKKIFELLDGDIMETKITLEEMGLVFSVPTGTPTRPASTAPTRPVSTAPTRPASTAPTRPVSTAPTRPVSTAPTRPVSTAPTRPVSTAPTRPASTAPTRPVSTAPTRPVSTAPTRPASTAPTRPASTAPTRPANTAPTRPVSTAPTRPANTAPTRPASTAPTRPANTAPTRPASTAPTRPASTAPTRPASTAPTRPASTPATTQYINQKLINQLLSNRESAQSEYVTNRTPEKKKDIAMSAYMIVRAKEMMMAGEVIDIDTFATTIKDELASQKHSGIDISEYANIPIASCIFVDKDEVAVTEQFKSVGYPVLASRKELSYKPVSWDDLETFFSETQLDIIKNAFDRRSFRNFDANVLFAFKNMYELRGLSENVVDYGFKYAVQEYLSLLSGKPSNLEIDYDFRKIYNSELSLKEIRQMRKFAKAAQKVAGKDKVIIEKASLKERMAGTLKRLTHPSKKALPQPTPTTAATTPTTPVSTPVSTPISTPTTRAEALHLPPVVVSIESCISAEERARFEKASFGAKIVQAVKAKGKTYVIDSNDWAREVINGKITNSFLWETSESLGLATPSTAPTRPASTASTIPVSTAPTRPASTPAGHESR